MSFLFFYPLAQPLDDNGDPMPGCYLQFYEHDSTTPTDVYADADLTTPLANPVASNSAGRFVQIYMDPEVVYRVQLYSAADVLLSDTDPVHAHVAFPPGTIVMFDGTEEERDTAYPPALWELCDGDNGTKDTRDRCPVGVSATKPISGAGSTGGTDSGTTDPAGAHDHGGDTGDTVLTADNMPLHNHRLYVKTASDSDNETFGFGSASTEGLTGQITADGPYGYVEAGNASDLVEEAGAADPDGHDHTITEEAAHTHDFDAQSPYFTVWFLKRKTA